MANYDDIDWSEYRRVRKNFLSQISYYEKKYDLSFEGEKPLTATNLGLDTSITQQDIDIMTQGIQERAKSISNEMFTPNSSVRSSNYDDRLYSPSALSDLKGSKQDYRIALDNFYELLGLPMPEKALRTGRNNTKGRFYNKPREVIEQATDSVNQIKSALDNLVSSIGEAKAGRLIWENSDRLNSALSTIRETYKSSDVASGFTEAMEILSSGPVSYSDLLGLAEDEYWEED